MEKDLSHNIKTELELEYRHKENYSVIKSSFIDAGVNYQFTDHLSLFSTVRYYFGEDTDRQRYSMGGSTETALSFFSFKYRLKIQHDIESEKGSSNEIRNRVTIDFPIHKRVKPYFSSEIFHMSMSSNYQFNEYRLTTGVRFKPIKAHSVKLFYTYKENDIALDNIEITNIAGVKYEYDLK